MPTRKRPILTVLTILGIVAFFLGTTMVLVLIFFGPVPELSFGDKIGVVPVEGPILDSHDVIDQIARFRKELSIKAIIIRIDSPGGGVGPSQEIYQEILRTSQEKKVVASLGGVAASGGYYIASAADRIVANPGTLTGSIGVLMQFLSFEELLGKIGIHLEVLKSGEFKDTGSPHRELTQKEKDLLQTLIADIQRQFVEAVARGRHLSSESVWKIADGRILSGAQAKELGLVDMMGNFHDAVALAKQLAGIEGEPALVYPKKSAIDVWQILFDSAAGAFTRLAGSSGPHIEYRWNGLSRQGLTETR
jgi:protease-4